MKAVTARAVSKVGWALGKTLNLVGFLGARIAKEVTNRPKHNIQVINTHTGEIMHEANNVSTVELNKILDAMRVLKGTVQVVIKNS
jgi:enhancing lycopene biosynthesis protein 2